LTFSCFIYTLDAGAKTGSLEYGHAGWEPGIVEEGKAEIRVGNEARILPAGDSVSFRFESPHVVADKGKKPLKVCWIITPPKGEEGAGI
jgi:mannose-6-phosphate isomerase-like protein (cupin superfamily)